MAKKKGVFHRILKLFRLIFNLIKWVLLKILVIAKWLIGMLKKANEKRKEKALENKRPRVEPTYEPFVEVEDIRGELKKFETVLYSNKSLIGLILGARGSGKSAIAMRILENIAAKTKRKTYCIGFDKKNLPKWIRPIDSLEEIKNGSFLIVDEGGIEFSSRKSMSNANKLLSELLLISRHKDLNVLFVSQNSANIEVNTIRQSDYLILKPPSLLQLDFERKKIKDIYENAEGKFKKYGNGKDLAYIYSDQYIGFVKNRLPHFWMEEISKSYRNKR